MITLAGFRADFPEFADDTKYPDALINTWLNLATTLVANVERWGNLLTTAQELVTAHYLVLQMRDLAAAASNNGAPGAPQGLVTSQAVGPVNESYDYSRATSEDAKQWNLTSYGQRYYSLLLLCGAGGVQLGGSLPSGVILF